MKNKLISAGVKNLNAFGYKQCNKDNILTDDIYKAFFISMLKDNTGHGANVDKAIDELLQQIENQ